MTEPRIRLDKWLWVARFAHSRSMAQAMCTSGLIRVGGVRVVKPSREIRPGDILTLPRPQCVLVLRILGYAKRRAPPPQSRRLYEILEGDSEMDDIPLIRTGARPMDVA